MIDDLDLLLDHRHSAGEIVVLPDLPGQLFQFRLRDSLCPLIAQQHACQRNAACDERYDDLFHENSSCICRMVLGYIFLFIGPPEERLRHMRRQHEA